MFRDSTFTPYDSTPRSYSPCTVVVDILKSGVLRYAHRIGSGGGQVIRDSTHRSPIICF
ncbi:hypothetical protein BRARA_D02215 [Brassica rapa]|uniref:Uncharacterized protein n=1 Tax=Brassica campestris TaxID=3711 RepID=A0A397ZPD1_BRACM|nr:hypothetical protein BRARA_D02215 [Brassica rapa]